MLEQEKIVYEFGPYRLDCGQNLLFRNDQVIPLAPKAAEMLLVLVENHGQLVEKEELMKAIWPDTFVEEANLTVHVSALRKLFQDASHPEGYIETVPRRGYRFVAAVHECTAGNGEISRVVATRQPEIVAPRPRPSRARLLVAGLCAITLLAAGFVLKGKARLFGPAPRQIHSVAVLPLQNLSGDPSQEYLADGLTEALVTDLAQVRSLRVISRTSTMAYKGTKKKLPEIARELNVDAVVEGSVMRSGDQVQVTAQLVEAPTDTHLWAETYEGRPRDLLQLQKRMAQAIVHEVRATLTPDEQKRQSSFRPLDSEAYDLFLKGRFYCNKRSLQGFEKAVEYLTESVQKDPNFALAYAGLADAYMLRGLTTSPSANFPEAEKAALKALELDENLGEAHTSLGAIRVFHDWDWAGAEKEFKRGIELSPNYATGHHWYSTLCLYFLGRSEEALGELRIAKELDPLSLAIDTDFASTYQATGQFDKAIELYRQIIEMDRTFAPVHYALGVAYEKKGMYREAMIEYREGDQLAGAKELMPETLGRIRTNSDYQRAVRWQLALAKQRSKQPGFWRYDDLARLYARLGEKDLAFSALRTAVEQRDPLVIFLKIDGQYDSLRSDPRIDPLLRRIGLSK
jgi:TolB-like protein/DNA-binding winged helix-turn-helix (wHTH) protein/Tfp pilus assembly protein PilF